MSQKQDITLYKNQGAKAFVERLPEMFQECLTQDVVKSYMSFVSDLLIDLNRFQDAIEVINKQEVRFLLDDVNYNNRGFCYDEISRSDLAANDYIKSLELNPKNKSSLRNLAYIDYLSEGKTPVEWTKNYYEQYPDIEESCLWYATSLWNHDLREQAFDFANKILSEHPDFSELEKLKKDFNKIEIKS